MECDFELLNNTRSTIPKYVLTDSVARYASMNRFLFHNAAHREMELVTGKWDSPGSIWNRPFAHIYFSIDPRKVSLIFRRHRGELI